MRRLKTVRRPPIYPNYPKSPGHLPCSSLTHPLPLPSRRPSVSFGGFGFRPNISLANNMSLNEGNSGLLIEMPDKSQNVWSKIEDKVKQLREDKNGIILLFVID